LKAFALTRGDQWPEQTPDMVLSDRDGCRSHWKLNVAADILANANANLIVGIGKFVSHQTA
jgi:hypothetical protein